MSNQIASQRIRVYATSPESALCSNNYSPYYYALDNYDISTGCVQMNKSLKINIFKNYNFIVYY